jgi:hypothetical protein
MLPLTTMSAQQIYGWAAANHPQFDGAAKAGWDAIDAELSGLRTRLDALRSAVQVVVARWNEWDYTDCTDPEIPRIQAAIDAADETAV